MKEYPQINRKEFKDWVTTEFKDVQETNSLFRHQIIVRDFMAKTPYRGILLYHGLGVGKTRSAIAICEACKKDVVVLLPASIKENFANEIKGYLNGPSKLKYDYIHYNGLTRKLISEMKNVFENKTIVIDELHNFISMVGNGSQNASRLYQMIMNAKNVKVVGLTGTPILNKPQELSYALNLVYGYIDVREIKVKTKALERVTELSKHPRVLFSKLLDDQSTIHYALAPPGFVKNENNLLVQSNMEDPLTDNNKPKITRHLLFPLNNKEFKKLFINCDSIKNPKMFERRIQGIVSHYEFYDVNEYPKQEPLKEVVLTMTDHQFETYTAMRGVEIDLEMNNKKSSNEDKDDADTDSVSLYKSYTRACCNFVFPKNIQRPFGKSIKYMASKELDDDIENDEGVPEEANTYSSQVKLAMSKLAKSEAISKENLATYSPKMLSILENIEKGPGPALVYTSFRNVEGVGILSLVLNKHGYDEVTVKTINGIRTLVNINSSKKKYIVFTNNRDTNKILMDLFNKNYKNVPFPLPKDFSGIDVIILTKSGSEGISLKNVRQVHLMEPYWNDIRVKQVIGRAIRAGSHKDLPPKERVVTPYIYLMTFSKAQKTNKSIVAIDHGLTTDEHIYRIANDKAKMNSEFLNILKRSALDCPIHSSKKCTKPTYSKQGDVYPLGPIDEDIEDEKVTDSNKVKKYVKLKKNGKEFLLNNRPLYFSTDDPNKLFYKENLGKKKPDALLEDIKKSFA